MIGNRQLRAGTAAGLAMLGLLLTLAAVVTDPPRLSMAFLAAALVFFLIPVAAGLLLALAGLIPSNWLTQSLQSLRRLALIVPRAGLLFTVAFSTSLFFYPGLSGPGRAFLFWGRGIVVVLAWTWITYRIADRAAGNSTAPRPRPEGVRPADSVLFLMIFFPTLWLAGADWAMTLAPGWNSSIFGLYNLAGVLLLGGATLALAHTSQPAPEKTLSDLSRFLLFASGFWIYTWFCQYLIVWYAGIPEEAGYFLPRMADSWSPLLFLKVTLNWILPTALLIGGASKAKPANLRAAAILILGGRWLDWIQLLLADEFGFSLALLPLDLGPALLLVAWVLGPFHSPLWAEEGIRSTAGGVRRSGR